MVLIGAQGNKFHISRELRKQTPCKIKITHFPNGMLVTSLRGVNYRLWSHMYVVFA